MGLDAATGKVRWAEAAGIIGEQVLVGPGGTFAVTPVPEGPTMLEQLDPATGKVGWTKRVSRGQEFASVVVGEVVSAVDEVEDPSLVRGPPSPGAPSAIPVTSLAPEDISTVTSFDPVSGRQLWRQSRRADGTALVAGKHTLLVSSGLADLQVRALDPRTGAQRWQSTTVLADLFQADAYGTPGVFFRGPSVVGLNLTNGRALWSVPNNPLYYTGTVAHGAAYLVEFAVPKHQPRGGG